MQCSVGTYRSSPALAETTVPLADNTSTEMHSAVIAQ